MTTRVLFRNPIPRPNGQEPRSGDAGGFLAGLSAGEYSLVGDAKKASKFSVDEARRIHRELRSGRWEVRNAVDCGA